MNYKIGFLIDLSLDKISYESYKDFIINLERKKIETVVIDISLSKKNKLKEKILIKYKELFKLNQKNFYQPKNIYDFEKIFINNKIILFYNYFLKEYKYLKINRSLIKHKIKNFSISNLGYNPISFNYVNKNYLKKINYFLKYRLNYFIFRILVIFNFFAKIDIEFEASNYIVRNIKNSISYKIKNKFKNIDISYYKSIIKINSKHYDDFLLKKNIIKNKYIVFVDGMPFDHLDVIYREGLFPKEDRNLYYKNLKLLLKKLSKKFKKKVIVCLHPKYDSRKIIKDYKGFKCFKYKTEKFIAQSSHVVFLESSSIVQAVLLKKKIITIHGPIIGNHGNRRCLAYAKDLGLNKIDIGNIKSWDLENLKFNKNRMNYFYEKYINKNIISDRNMSTTDQIIKTLSKLK
tara:strand:+ start:3227 stop:4438 length:1212 start_codon:yes stop_codon:yes gene_type:complete